MSGFPNTFIVGAPKAGTTGIIEYLRQHKDVYVPLIKEPRTLISQHIKGISSSDPIQEYIQSNSILDLDDYHKLYSVNKAVRVDASVQYLYHCNQVIPQIKRNLDSNDVRIVIMLRNPIDRAYSNYLYNLNDPAINFLDAIEKNDQRIAEVWNSFWYYKSQSLYAKNVKCYLNEFDNVKIILFEDFVIEPARTLADLYSFLEVEGIPFRRDEVRNKSGVPKNGLVKHLFFQDSLLKKLGRKLTGALPIGIAQYIKLELRNKFTKKPEGGLREDERQYVYQLFKEDIDELENVIQRDLSAWRL